MRQQRIHTLDMSKQQTIAGPTAPTSISVFLTNIHLLDLDRRDDWPSIDSHTFTRKNTLQNEKTRILCVEWALYRLFEIWDIEETRNVRHGLMHRSLNFADKISVEIRAILPSFCAFAITQSTSSSI